MHEVGWMLSLACVRDIAALHNRKFVLKIGKILGLTGEKFEKIVNFRLASRIQSTVTYVTFNY